MSAYVLARALPQPRIDFHRLINALASDEDRTYALAALNDLLTELSGSEFVDVVSDADLTFLEPYWQNYLAAMVEQAASQKDVAVPEWVRNVEELDRPHFVTPLRSLRLHLLRSSPVPFRRRNIFVDSAVGDRV
jgi:hypothetical protein